MKVYNHDKLHELTDNNPQLKQRSDEVHSLPPNDEWGEFERRKYLMIDIWADAIGCQQRDSAIIDMGMIINYFSRYTKSLGDLRLNPQFQEYLAESKKMESELANNKRCHIAGGNSYICFCNESG